MLQIRDNIVIGPIASITERIPCPLTYYFSTRIFATTGYGPNKYYNALRKLKTVTVSGPLPQSKLIDIFPISILY